jgi:hypothetical protein
MAILPEELEAGFEEWLCGLDTYMQGNGEYIECDEFRKLSSVFQFSSQQAMRKCSGTSCMYVSIRLSISPFTLSRLKRRYQYQEYHAYIIVIMTVIVIMIPVSQKRWECRWGI